MPWFKSYRYRFKFEISSTNVDAALADFPVALFFNSTAGTGSDDVTKIFDAVGADWSKIAVCEADERTPLWTEVDLWDVDNENGVLHVRVPNISSSQSTYLYVYFDPDGVGNGYIGQTGSDAAKNVWDDDFAAVWHMNGDPSVASDLKNSKADSHHLTGVNMESADSVDSDTIGKAVNLDGTNEHLVTALSGLPLVNEEKTVEILANNDDTNRLGLGSRLDYGGVNNESKGWYLSFDPANTLRRYYHSSAGEISYSISTTTNIDRYLAVTVGVNAASPVLYLDGSSVTPTTNDLATGTAESTSGYFGFGKEAIHYANGQVSEARLSSVARSAAWIKATYYTLFDNLGDWKSLEASLEAADGWLADWKYRRQITIPSTGISGDLENFPLALFLNSSAGTSDVDMTAVFDELGANSHKLAVTDHTGVRQLYVEVDNWDNSAESAVLHVGVPFIDSAVDTTLYLYYDSAKADNDGYVGDTGDAVAQNVWDDNFVAVFHMNDDPSGGTLTDASGTSDATASNFESGDQTDSDTIGTQITADGSNEKAVTGANCGISGTDPWTCEVILKPTATVQNQIGIGVVSSNGLARAIQATTTEIAIAYQGGRWGVTGTFSAAADTYIVGRLPSGSSAMSATKLDIDGVSQSVSLTAGSNYTINTTDSAIALWLNTPTGTVYGDSPMSEVRLSDTERSDAWIAATYNTLFDQLFSYAAAGEVADVAGWLRGFTKRSKITIPSTNIDGALDYFPLTVHLSSSCGTGTDDMTPVFDEIGANHKKLAITLADGRTQLPIEVDLWDDTNERAVLHARVPNISSSDTTYLYLYFSADVPDNNEYVGGIGDSVTFLIWNEYQAVWHMSDDPSGTAPQAMDSTKNENHGTAAGTMLTGDYVDGKAGKAWDLDGTDDEFTVPDNDTLDCTTAYDLTVEAVVNSDTASVMDTIVDTRTTGQGGFILGFHSDNTAHFWVGDGTDSAEPTGDTTLTRDGTTWYYVGGRFDRLNSNDLDVWVNAADDVTSTTAATNVDDLSSTGSKYFGSNAITSSWTNWSGELDEIRVTFLYREDAWMKATYYSLFDTLLSYDTTFETQDSWLGNWAKRIKLTIDSSKISSSLTNFPVAVLISDASGTNDHDVTAIFDELGANNLKMAVTTDDGLTQTYAEIAYWNTTSERGEVHVLLPSISSSADTVFYLYFDSSQSDNSTYIGVTGATAAEYVWDTAGFEAVYHMCQDPSGSLLDSTSNGHDGTFYGSMDSNDLVESPKGMALDFDGNDDYITIPNSNLLDPDQYDYTYEVFYLTSKDYTSAAGRIYNDYGTDTDNYIELTVQTTNKISHYMRDLGGDALAIQTAGADIDDGLWHHNAMARDTTTHMDAYEDGSWIDEVTNASVGNIRTDSGALPTIGKHASAASNYFQGRIGEIRLTYNVALSAAWIGATYSTLMDELLHFSTGELTNQWPTGWNNRKPFVIPATNIDADLTDFPIAMVLDSAAGTGSTDITDIFDEVGANYKRVAVGDAQGRLLPAEIDTWDSSTEKAVLHVKVPRIDSDYGALLFLYYDNDQPDQGWVGDTGEHIAQRVWDDNFVGVYHFSQDPSGTSPQMLDSTAGENNLTSTGSMTDTDLIDSEPGKGLDFDGSNDGVTTSVALITAYPYTLEVAGPANVVAATATGPAINLADNSAADQQVLVHIEDGYARLNHYATTSYTKDGTTLLTDDVFCHLAGVGVSATERSILTNGSNKQTDTTSVTFPTGVDRASVGFTNDSSPFYFAGEASEARFSDYERPDAWLKATYYTLADNLGAWGATEYEPYNVTITETLSKAGRITFSVNTLDDELSIQEDLAKAGRITFTSSALAENYVGNITKMIAAAGSRPRIASATGTRPGIASASGAGPRLAAAEAFAFQEKE
jgi:hypothetical protein